MSNRSFTLIPVLFVINPATSSICGQCLTTTPYFDQIITPYQYKGSSPFLIQSLKFKAKHSCAKIMGELMAEHMKALGKKPDAVMAVPLHPKRLRERGFNQSDSLTTYLHRTLQVNDMSRHLKRIINTSSQSSLNATERRKNIKNAFEYTGNTDIQSVAVIDDVVTTGSTANEIAKVLKAAGGKHVEVWAFARA